VAFEACCPRGVLLTDVPLRPALGVVLRDAEPLSPVLTGYSPVPRVAVSPLLVGAAMPVGLDVAAAPVWPVVPRPAV
jgi:hypothetical protein